MQRIFLQRNPEPVFASRELTTILERLDSSQRQRDQAEAQLSEVQNQTSSLPRAFPWPGLGERRQAVEQVRSLQEQTAALAPALANVRTLVGGSKNQRCLDTCFRRADDEPAVLCPGCRAL